MALALLTSKPLFLNSTTRKLTFLMDDDKFDDADDDSFASLLDVDNDDWDV